MHGVGWKLPRTDVDTGREARPPCEPFDLVSWSDFPDCTSRLNKPASGVCPAPGPSPDFFSFG
eukprot:3560450-Pyramimonas_sp.AAC.1